MKARNHADHAAPILRTILCASLIAATPALAAAEPAAPQLGAKAKAAAGKAGSAAKQSAGKAKKAADDPLGAIAQAVEQTRSQVESLVQRAEMGASFIDGPTLEQIVDQARGAVNLIRDQFEGKDEFVSQHAQQFKADLIGFLTDVRTLRHEVRSLTTSECWPRVQTAERTPLVDLIERVPDGLLYPAWKGLPENFECLVQDVRDGAESVRTIRAILGDLSEPMQVGPLFDEESGLAAHVAMFKARLDAAQPYLRHHDELSAAAARLTKASKAAELFGSVLDTLAESSDTDVELGLHGYALITVEVDTLKALSDTIGSGGKMAGDVASFVNGKLSKARSVSTESLILAQQEEILRNQEAILAGR